MKIKTTIVILLVLFTASMASGQKFKAKVAPDFTLKDINGNNVTLSESYGEGPIYISFWATWCKPCKEELKIMGPIYKKYKDQGFRIFAINTEGPKAMGKIKSFAKSSGWNFDILIDPDGEVFRRKYKGFAMPFTVMTDNTGKVIFSVVGFKPGDEAHIEELILQQLAESSEDTEDKSETEE